MKQWQYSDSKRGNVGDMICGACGKEINGMFRFRATPRGFSSQHRECSVSDRRWAKIDLREEHTSMLRERELGALVKYISEFGVPDHDLVEQALMEIERRKQ